MNKNILNALFVGSIALGLASCGENSWNNHYLDGFEGGVNYDNSVEASYTLTDADYSTISSLLKSNENTDEQKAAAKAIATNLYFDKTSPFPASVALPVFFESSSFPYYLSPNGSTVDVVYAEASAVPAELTAIAAAEKYTVSTDNYKAVWESDEDFIKGFAPMKPAANYLPNIIAEAFPEAVNGNYAVVSYEVASTNPVFNKADDAPKVYINETFADGMGDFTMDNVLLPTGSTYVWSYDSHGYMKASGYVGGKNCDSEGWLISPEVTLSAKANAVLSFEQAWNYFSDLTVAADQATVSVREKGGQWVKLTVPTVPTKQGWSFVASGDIDLSSYNGKTIQIGFCYKSTAAKAGTLELKNVLLQDGDNLSRSRSLAAEVPTESINAVYYYNGSKWSVATDVVVLNPADYTAMGVSNNKLVDPEINLPIFLKGKLPYAQAGDQEYVVYNGTKADLLVYDGTAWTVNNNGLETVTGRFTKKDGTWSFVKYIGKAIFNKFDADQIIRDRSYIFVSGDVCATVIDKNSNYGYLYTTSVSISNDQIILSSDANAFTFASQYVAEDGKVTKAPEGKFLIRDSYNRYLYRSGSFASANVAKAPSIEDGAITEAYLWSAKHNDDGTWSVSCTVGESTRTYYYSTSYGNFAIYETGTDVDVLPELYMLDSGEDDSDNAE